MTHVERFGIVGGTLASIGGGIVATLAPILYPKAAAPLLWSGTGICGVGLIMLAAVLLNRSGAATTTKSSPSVDRSQPDKRLAVESSNALTIADALSPDLPRDQRITISPVMGPGGVITDEQERLCSELRAALMNRGFRIAGRGESPTVGGVRRFRGVMPIADKFGFSLLVGEVARSAT